MRVTRLLLDIVPALCVNKLDAPARSTVGSAMALIANVGSSCARNTKNDATRGRVPKNGQLLACLTRQRVLGTRCAIRRFAHPAKIVIKNGAKVVGSGTAVTTLRPPAPYNSSANRRDHPRSTDSASCHTATSENPGHRRRHRDRSPPGRRPALDTFKTPLV